MGESFQASVQKIPFEVFDSTDYCYGLYVCRSCDIPLVGEWSRGAKDDGKVCSIFLRDLMRILVENILKYLKITTGCSKKVVFFQLKYYFNSKIGFLKFL